jgi:MoaA/NifB/PqqE/SkfB family radical SAM enzyme
MTSYTDIVSAIQIELSTLCNSLCIGCVRTDANLVNTKSFIPKNQFLPLEKVVNLFNTETGKRLKKVEFCGTIDEPLAYPHFEKLINALYDTRPDLKISIDTNGSIKDPSFHFRLSQKLSKFNQSGILKYSIDGIGATHEFYRFNTSYDKALENMKAAVKGGTDVFWQYVVFPWNKSQKEEARRLAEEIKVLGINFRIDRGGASDYSQEEISQIRENRIPPLGRPQGVFDINEFVPRPSDQEISCRFIDENGAMIFLAWDGRIWPCCFFANVYYAKTSSQRAFEKYIIDRYQQDFNSIYKHSLDKILSSELFQNDLMTSWKDHNSKLSWRCNEKCSKRVKCE